MDRVNEESSADSAVDIKEVTPQVTPLVLTSLSPRTPRSPGSRSDSEGEAQVDEDGAIAEPEDDRPREGFVKKRVNDVSNHICCCCSMFLLWYK